MLLAMLFVTIIETTDSQHHGYVTVLSGTTARLSCPAYSISSVRWDFKPLPHGLHGTLTVYNGFDISPRFSGRFNVTYNATTGSSDLRVIDVTQDDAGVYTCIDRSVAQTKLDIELGVLDGQPQCSTNSSLHDYTVMEHQHVSVECGVRYRGNASVNTRCVNNLLESGDNPGSVTKNTTCVVYRKTYVFDRRMNRSVLLCTVMIGSNYSHIWTSRAVSVTYGPTSVTITQKSTVVFQHDDKLTCSSDGYPEPVYNWVSGHVTQRGRQFTVDICDMSRDYKSNVKRRKSELLKVLELTCFAKRDTQTASATVNISVSFSDYDNICDDAAYGDPEIKESKVLFNAVIGGVVGIVLSVVVGIIIVCFRTYEFSCSRRGTTPLVTPPVSVVSSQSFIRRFELPLEDLTPVESHEISPAVDATDGLVFGRRHGDSQITDGYEEMRYSNQQIEQAAAEERQQAAETVPGTTLGSL